MTKRLSPQQEKFCRLYASDVEFFGNGVQSYIEVYQPNQKKPNWYAAARAAAVQVLSSKYVIARINELLEETGYSEPHVDKQLSFLLTQHADLPTKLGAIKEYNKLKGRITEKAKVEHIFPAPIYGGKSKQ